MADNTLTFFVATEALTQTLGVTLASHIVPGDLMLLEGDLGAGKSALARATIRTLLAQPQLEVPSPTFLLVLAYEGNDWSVDHADLYRLNDHQEIEELGITEMPDRVTLVEWPERAPELYERADLHICIAIPAGDAGRQVTIGAPRDPARLNALREALAAQFEFGESS